MLGFWALVLLYGSALFADFLAPYHYASSARKKAYHPPMITWVRVADANGLRWPYVTNSAYEFDVNQRKVYRPTPGDTHPIGLFVKGDPYRLLGLFETRVHLFGLRGLEAIDPEDPNRPMLFLLGADNFGRDVLSRLLYGGRISLSVGLIGVAITFVLGMLVGGASGYFGGRTDIAIQRLCEMLMLIPGFYLLLSLRAAIPRRLVVVSDLRRHHRHSQLHRLGRIGAHHSRPGAVHRLDGLRDQRPRHGRAGPPRHRAPRACPTRSPTPSSRPPCPSPATSWANPASACSVSVSRTRKPPGATCWRCRWTSRKSSSTRGFSSPARIDLHHRHGLQLSR